MQIGLIKQISACCATAAVLLFVQACGGGGGGSAPDPAPQAAAPATATPDVSPVTVAPLEPVAPLAPIAPVAPVPPLAPVAPVAPIAPVVPVVPVTPVAPAPSPVSTSPAGGEASSGLLDYRVDTFEITTPVTGAKPYGIYYSDTITVSGLSPGVSVHCIATGAGYVDAGASALSGTYRSVVEAFEVSADGTFLLRVAGVASNTPGATVSVTVSITTFSGYGATFQSGLNTTAQFPITTAP